MFKPVQLVTGEVRMEEPFFGKWLVETDKVRSHPLWQDPFMITLGNINVDPSLSYNLVKEWAKQMFHGSLAFPRYVGNLIGRVSNHCAGRKLSVNAAVERGYPGENRSHFLLAVDLLRSMGLKDEEIVAIPELKFSADYISGHLNYTRNEALAKGIGCLGLGIEALTTHEFTVLGNAYIRTAPSVGGLDHAKTYQNQGYFTENIMADAEHQVEFAEIAFLTWKSGEIPPNLDLAFEQIAEGAKYSLDLRQKFFAGIYNSVCKRD